MRCFFDDISGFECRGEIEPAGGHKDVSWLNGHTDDTRGYCRGHRALGLRESNGVEKSLRETIEWIRDFVVKTNPGKGKLVYYGPYDLVLREGREFEPVPWSSWGGRYTRGRLRECFKNAYELSVVHDELVYCEGYATRAEMGLPIHHAWCVTEDGKVVDPTWRDEDGRDGEGSAYIGIAFEGDFVDEATDRKGSYGVFDDYEIFKTGFPEGAII